MGCGKDYPRSENIVRQSASFLNKINDDPISAYTHALPRKPTRLTKSGDLGGDLSGDLKNA